MDIDELFPPKKKVAAPAIGESLATLSLADLESRLAQLADERARVEAEIAARKASRAAADDIFKR